MEEKEKDKLEFRSLENIEVRESEGEAKELVLDGYIAKFDSATELWTGYFEKIDRSAFDDTLKDGHNIFLLYSHDYSKPLASTRNETLKLSVDKAGLKFEAKINSKLSYASDVHELVKSGEVRGCSFGFRVLQHSVEYDRENDTVMRTLKKIDLREGTITAIPAYEDTVVQARAKQFREEFNSKDEEVRALTQDLDELELLYLEKEFGGNING